MGKIYIYENCTEYLPQECTKEKINMGHHLITDIKSNAQHYCHTNKRWTSDTLCPTNTYMFFFPGE